LPGIENVQQTQDLSRRSMLDSIFHLAFLTPSLNLKK